MAGCQFCEIAAGRPAADGFYLLPPRWEVLHERDGYNHVVAFEPLNPVTPGHTLLVSCHHTGDAASEPTLTAMVFDYAARYAADRGVPFNLITSAGAAASQTVDHFHVHYVPRRPGDGLLLPWSNQ